MSGPKGPPRIQFTNNGSSFLPPTHSMSPGQYLQSPNKRFKLILQNDINLVLFDGAAPIWSAQGGQPYTNLLKPVKAVPNSFYIWYNLVLVDHTRNRCWTTTSSTPTGATLEAAGRRAYLALQDDGNLVSIDSIPLWNSVPSIPSTPGHSSSIFFPSGTSFAVGHRYSAGSAGLVFQADGNLVLFGANGQALWTSKTPGAARAVMQEDGNFVIYNASNVAMWSTRTQGKPGAVGRLQSNGGFSVVYERPTWARFGFVPTIIPPRVFYPDHSTGPFPTFKDWTFKF
ncbi:D-mannose binding lectin [compost metagenome]